MCHMFFLHSPKLNLLRIPYCTLQIHRYIPVHIYIGTYSLLRLHHVHTLSLRYFTFYCLVFLCQGCFDIWLKRYFLNIWNFFLYFVSCQICFTFLGKTSLNVTHTIVLKFFKMQNQFFLQILQNSLICTTLL